MVLVEPVHAHRHAAEVVLRAGRVEVHTRERARAEAGVRRVASRTGYFVASWTVFQWLVLTWWPPWWTEALSGVTGLCLGGTFRAFRWFRGCRPADLAVLPHVRGGEAG
ncbi:hypothetical protein GCM10010149_55930 [Nonomuraea roseoviolacea subsp. roseoviolacea]